MKKKSIVIFFVSLLIFGATYFVVEQVMGITIASTIKLKDEDLGKGNIIERRAEGELLFLLVGVDENPDVEGKAKVTNVRTDTMIITKVNFDEGTIDLVSIPRDSQVIFDGRKMKITEVHSSYGITGTMKAARELTGLDIDYYMSVDFNAVKKLVDAVGGVEIDIPYKLDEPQLNVYIPSGKSVVDGNNALYFVRARDKLPTGTDIERMKNQQYFLGQLMDAVLKPSNILKIGEILDVFKENVKFSFDISDLGNLALTASRFNSDKMFTQTLEWYDKDEYPNGKKISYVIVKEKEMNELFSKRFRNYFIDESMIDDYKNDENANMNTDININN